MTDNACRDGQRGGPRFALDFVSSQVCVLSGEVDLAAVPAVEAVANSLRSPTLDTLFIDCRSVTFADCSALGALLDLSAQAESLGKRLVLRSVPSVLSRLICLAQVSDRLTIDSRHTASTTLPDSTA